VLKHRTVLAIILTCVAVEIAIGILTLAWGIPWALLSVVPCLAMMAYLLVTAIRRHRDQQRRPTRGQPTKRNHS
jgi:membrane protein implicated in regulation of membrane protease activity